MVEVRRTPRWLKVITVIVIVIAGFWFWLDSAFRAPDVIPVLRQTQVNGDANSVVPDFSILTKSDDSETIGSTDVASNKSNLIEIDCSSPEQAEEQVSDWIDRSFGGELTEFVLSGAISWAEKNPATLRESWTAPDGLDAPAGYASYTDSMLKAAADNGDALAAAVFGAKQVKAAQKEIVRLEPEALQAKLTLAEHYLQQGIHAKVSGVLQFYWRSAELQAERSRTREGDGYDGVLTNRNAVIETYARMLLIQLYGSFEERTMAHLMLSMPNMLPVLNDDDERKAAFERARSLASQFAGADVARSPEERRAENAVVALLTAGMRQMDVIDNMRCSDGRLLADVLPEDAFEDLAGRYGFME